MFCYQNNANSSVRMTLILSKSCAVGIRIWTAVFPVDCYCNFAYDCKTMFAQLSNGLVYGLGRVSFSPSSAPKFSHRVDIQPRIGLSFIYKLVVGRNGLPSKDPSRTHHRIKLTDRIRTMTRWRSLGDLPSIKSLKKRTKVWWHVVAPDEEKTTDSIVLRQTNLRSHINRFLYDS